MRVKKNGNSGSKNIEMCEGNEGRNVKGEIKRYYTIFVGASYVTAKLKVHNTMYT